MKRSKLTKVASRRRARARQKAKARQLYDFLSKLGIKTATYSLWENNSHNLGASTLTLDKILKAAAIAAATGCTWRDPPIVWVDEVP